MKSKNNLKGSQGQEPCNILTVTFQPYTIVFYFCLYFKEKINLNKKENVHGSLRQYQPRLLKAHL